MRGREGGNWECKEEKEGIQSEENEEEGYIEERRENNKEKGEIQ